MRAPYLQHTPYLLEGPDIIEYVFKHIRGQDQIKRFVLERQRAQIFVPNALKRAATRPVRPIVALHVSVDPFQVFGERPLKPGFINLQRLYAREAAKLIDGNRPAAAELIDDERGLVADTRRGAALWTRKLIPYGFRFGNLKCACVAAKAAYTGKAGEI